MKRGVTRVLLGAAVAVALLPLTGCETLYQTPGENLNMVVNSANQNRKMAVTDAEWLLLLDRPSWLSQAPMPSFY